MTKVVETLETFTERLGRLSAQYRERDIIFSDELEQKEYLLDGPERDIIKEPILWPLMNYNMFYVVSTVPTMKTPKHSHSESVFRVLISGSLRINGRLVDKPGVWFVVRKGTPYEIETDTGYVAISGYGEACKTRGEASPGGGFDEAHIVVNKL